MKGLLSAPAVYVALQKALGADRLRHRALQLAGIRPGEVVVDVGCANAYYLDRIPPDAAYHGFDTSARYIDDARRRWPERNFEATVFDDERAAAIGDIDVLLLLGVLHHLSDDDLRSVLGLAARHLTKTGRVVTVDTTFDDAEGRVSRWLGENDRGEHVRTAERFRELATESLELDSDLLTFGDMRVPGCQYYMVLRTRAEDQGEG